MEFFRILNLVRRLAWRDCMTAYMQQRGVQLTGQTRTRTNQTKSVALKESHLRMQSRHSRFERVKGQIGPFILYTHIYIWGRQTRDDAPYNFNDTFFSPDKQKLLLYTRACSYINPKGPYKYATITREEKI